MIRSPLGPARDRLAAGSSGPPRRLPPLAILALVVALLAACSGPRGEATATPAPSPTAPLARATTAAPTATAPAPAPRATATTRAATARVTATGAGRAATGTRPAGGTAARSTGTAYVLGPPDDVTQLGLRGQTISAVAAHVSNPNLVYAAGKGVSRSTDGGQTWTEVLTEKQIAAKPVIALAPSNASIVYVGVSEGCAKGGKPKPGFVSTDSGANWRETGAGLAAIAVDPRNARLAYAATCRGIERTSDLGETWEVLAGAKVENYEPTHVAVAPADVQTLYAVYASEGGTIRVRRSENGGTSWQDANPSGEPFGPIDLAVDSADPRLVYLSAANGVFRTKNGGRAWDRLTEGLEATVQSGANASGTRTNTALLADPTAPNVVWLGTGARGQEGSGIYQSTNQGARWRQVTDFERRAVRRLALGGRDSGRRLYIATEDGVWLLTPGAPQAP